MDEQSILALRNNNLLKNADFSKLNLDQIKGRVHTISLGEVLFKKGDSANSMYLILDGEINLLDKKNYGNHKPNYCPIILFLFNSPIFSSSKTYPQCQREVFFKNRI